MKCLDALVTACVSEYTELQPEFQELKENFRKIAENEKEKAQQENNDRKNFGGRDRGEKFSTKAFDAKQRPTSDPQHA